MQIRGLRTGVPPIDSRDAVLVRSLHAAYFDVEIPKAASAEAEAFRLTMRVFISYHTPDRPIAIALQLAIKAALPDADIFLDQSHLRFGYNWQPALYEAIEKSDALLALIGNRLGNWQTAEYYAAHDKKVQNPDTFLLLPIIFADRSRGPVPNLPGLSQLHWIECSEPTAPDTLPSIIGALAGKPIPEPPKPWMLVNPYRGLMALEEQDRTSSSAASGRQSRLLSQSSPTRTRSFRW
jgi:hypothetical protein